MAKLTYSVLNNTQSNLDITSYIKSMRLSFGRESPIAPLQGATAYITLNNDALQSEKVLLGDVIWIRASTPTQSGNTVFVGQISNRDFDDRPGNGVGSTITIKLDDSLALSGYGYIDVTLAEEYDQLEELAAYITNNSGTLEIINPTTTLSMQIGAFNGNVLQRMQTILQGDKGVMFLNPRTGLNPQIIYYSPALFRNLIIYVSGTTETRLTFGRTTGTYQIAYDQFDRSELSSENLFFNHATITGALGTAGSTNQNSVANYGIRTFTATTIQTEAVVSSAEWYANAYVDQDAEVLTIGFSNIIQESSALDRMFINFFGGGCFNKVYWQPPGGTATSGLYLIEHTSITMLPEETRFTVKMYPLTIYNHFTLDDVDFGVLNTSRLSVGPAI
jgi:hypothetical protein